MIRPAPNPRVNRRAFFRLGARVTLAGAALLALPRPLRAAHHVSPLKQAIASSPLVYISPLKRDGSESTCQGEVWFVTDGDDLLVVTNPERWRAACIGQGLDRARLWVGDYGLWKRAKGRYKEAPSTVARASLEGSEAVHAEALGRFGQKYSDEWGKWGPRFEKGLASGERVMIRYSPVSEGA